MCRGLQKRTTIVHKGKEKEKREKQQQILSGPDNRDVLAVKKHCDTVKSMETVFPPFSVTGNTAGMCSSSTLLLTNDTGQVLTYERLTY